MRNQLSRSTPVTGASTNCYTVKHRSSLFLVRSLRSFTYGHKKCPAIAGRLILLRRGRDYRHTPCDTVIHSGGSQIKWMPVRSANSHFYFCAFAGASSATLQNKNAPDKVGGHPFDLRRGRDSNPRYKFKLV